MGILTWIVMGLVVGAVAKYIMPGKDPGGIFVTMLIGIAGAMLGGWIGATIGIGEVTGFDLTSLGLAIAGSLILLAAYRFFNKDDAAEQNTSSNATDN